MWHVVLTESPVLEAVVVYESSIDDTAIYDSSIDDSAVNDSTVNETTVDDVPRVLLLLAAEGAGALQGNAEVLSTLRPGVLAWLRTEALLWL